MITSNQTRKIKKQKGGHPRTLVSRFGESGFNRLLQWGHRTPSLQLIYLLPAAHTLWRWFYLHFHPHSPPSSLVLLDLFLGEKKMTDDILIHISLYAILRVVRVNLFPAPWCSLIWGIFWSWESEEVWHKRIFLVIKRAGTDTTFLSCRSQQAVKAVKPSHDAPHPPLHPSSSRTINLIWLGSSNPFTPI